MLPSVLVVNSRRWRACTVEACSDIAGFSIFARKGMVVGRERESWLRGREAFAQQGRKNINGSKFAIFEGMQTSLSE